MNKLLASDFFEIKKKVMSFWQRPGGVLLGFSEAFRGFERGGVS